MSEIGKFFFDGTIAAAVLPFLFQGFLVTLQLSALTILFGLSLGLALACARAYGIMPLNLLIVAFVDILRSLPALVILICIYFVLPEYEIRIDAYWATVLTLGLVLAALHDAVTRVNELAQAANPMAGLGMGDLDLGGLGGLLGLGGAEDDDGTDDDEDAAGSAPAGS